MPNAFTEANIRIIRVFTKLREYALTHKEILLQLARLEKEVKGNSKEFFTIVLSSYVNCSTALNCCKSSASLREALTFSSSFPGSVSANRYLRNRLFVRHSRQSGVRSLLESPRRTGAE